MSPTFSVLTPVYDPPADVLRAAIDSVLGQTFEDWELVLVDDASTHEAVRTVLASAAASDPRIRVVLRDENGGIAAASQEALSAAGGDFIALLDHDDVLDPSALEEMHDAITSNPEADYLYSDEDHLDEQGEPFGPFFKPDWSPERMRAQNYTCHLSVLRRSLAIEIGGFRPGFDGSQDYDLFLRATERARSVVHVPKVLYHWRLSATSAAGNPDAKPYAVEAALGALREHCARVGIDGAPEVVDRTGVYRIRRVIDGSPLVSVVLPTRGSMGRVFGTERCFVLDCIRSFAERSSYRHVEFVVIADADMPESVRSPLREIDDVELRLVEYDHPFNFSRKINLGAVHARGEYLLLLNDDIELIRNDSLEVMLGLAQAEDVGMVGCKLVFPDGSLQHGGHVYGRWPAHAFYGAPPPESGPGSLLWVDREVSGVTAACALVRSSVFEEVGGMTTALPRNFNDVDFSLKVRRAGYRILWTPHAELYHFESKTRDPRVEQFELDVLAERWRYELDHDPYFNPNLEPGESDWRPKAGVWPRRGGPLSG